MTKTLCFSQIIYPKAIINNTDTLVLITPLQLKHTNLIFVEHNALKLKVDVLTNIVTDYTYVIANDNIIINNKNKQIDILQKADSSNKQIIYNQNLQISKQKESIKWLTIGGVTISLGLLVTLLIVK